MLRRWKKEEVGRAIHSGRRESTLKQILDQLGDITGLPSPKIKLPYLFAFAAGVVDEAITGRLLKREPRATVDTVRMGKKKMFASSAKAERELGWKIVPVDECAAAGGGVVPEQRICLESQLWPRWSAKCVR